MKNLKKKILRVNSVFLFLIQIITFNHPTVWAEMQMPSLTESKPAEKSAQAPPVQAPSAPVPAAPSGSINSQTADFFAPSPISPAVVTPEAPKAVPAQTEVTPVATPSPVPSATANTQTAVLNVPAVETQAEDAELMGTMNSEEKELSDTPDDFYNLSLSDYFESQYEDQSTGLLDTVDTNEDLDSTQFVSMEVDGEDMAPKAKTREELEAEELKEKEKKAALRKENLEKLKSLKNSIETSSKMIQNVLDDITKKSGEMQKKMDAVDKFLANPKLTAYMAQLQILINKGVMLTPFNQSFVRIYGYIQQERQRMVDYQEFLNNTANLLSGQIEENKKSIEGNVDFILKELEDGEVVKEVTIKDAIKNMTDTYNKSQNTLNIFKTYMWGGKGVQGIILKDGKLGNDLGGDQELVLGKVVNKDGYSYIKIDGLDSKAVLIYVDLKKDGTYTIRTTLYNSEYMGIFKDMERLMKQADINMKKLDPYVK